MAGKKGKVGPRTQNLIPDRDQKTIDDQLKGYKKAKKFSRKPKNIGKRKIGVPGGYSAKKRKKYARGRDWAPMFLKCLSLTANIREACEKAGIKRRAAYLYREKNAEFAQAWDDALQGALDDLEGALHERGKTHSDRAAEYLLTVHRYPKSGSVNFNFVGKNGEAISHEEFALEARREYLINVIDSLRRLNKAAEEQQNTIDAVTVSQVPAIINQPADQQELPCESAMPN